MDTSALTKVSMSPDQSAANEDVTSYRTLSILALASLLLGIASPLCVVAPLLMAIPVCGAVLAIAAILRIEWSEGAMFGRKAALIGLGLSVASICGVFTRTIVMEKMLSSQARAAGTEFAQLLTAGEIDKAFELTLQYAQGPPPKHPDKPGAPPAEPPPDPREQFRTNPVVEFMAKIGADPKVEYERDLMFAPGARDEYSIVQLYRVSGGESAAGAEQPLKLSMLRIRANRLSDAHWVVERYERDSTPPPVAD